MHGLVIRRTQRRAAIGNRLISGGDYRMAELFLLCQINEWSQIAEERAAGARFDLRHGPIMEAMGCQLSVPPASPTHRLFVDIVVVSPSSRPGAPILAQLGLGGCFWGATTQDGNWQQTHGHTTHDTHTLGKGEGWMVDDT